MTKSRETSLAALKSLKGARGTILRKIYDLMLERDCKGMTCDEAEEIFALPDRVIQLSARFWDLHNAGWVYRTKRKRRTRSGRWATIYRAREVCKPRLTKRCPTCGHITKTVRM